MTAEETFPETIDCWIIRGIFVCSDGFPADNDKYSLGKINVYNRVQLKYWKLSSIGASFFILHTILYLGCIDCFI